MKYKKIETKFISDIASEVTIYEHIKTKARVATIANDDKNKVFSIAFRTPAINSTGLTHILEHSVLCGSKKYPVKDPFVELLKSSLNTFLNAFTFPDKTMYPCASQNDKDFKNLMDVYLDSVFHPNIYLHKEIFMQEGWHYKLENIDDEIEYTGVVYNEMKGAFSDPEQVLGREILHTLFPDNCYTYESGGDPKMIPDLSYEEFCSFHQKYYHPSNSFIFIYGDCDMEERLDYLDKEYLANYSYDDFNTVIMNQAPFTSPVKENVYYPIGKEESLDNKAYLSYNLALENDLSNKDILALNTIFRILFDEPGAIIKQAILDSNIGKDVDCSFDSGIKYPMLSIIVKEANEASLQKFIDLLNTEFTKVVNEGINKEELKAILDYQEFKTREAKFSYPKGIAIAMAMLDTWLYNDSDKFSRLEELRWYKELKEECNTSYYEDLIKKYVLANNHKSYVTLIPSYTAAEEADNALKNKLAVYKKSLSTKELNDLVEANKNLKAYQESPSTKEEIATLPKLTMDDIDKAPEKLNLAVYKEEFEVLFSEYNTNEIGYYTLYFDVSKLDYKLVPYTKLLTYLLTLVDTKKYKYQALAKLINSYSGGLKANYSASKTYSDKVLSMVSLDVSYLPSKANEALELLANVLFESKFDDSKRIYELLCQMKNSLESYISYRGNSVALTRAGSKLEEASYLNDLTNGIGYLDFITDLIKNYDAKKEEIKTNLEYLASVLFTKENLTLGFTGDTNGLAKAKEFTKELYTRLNDKANIQFDAKFVKASEAEAIKTQYNVNYVAKYGLFEDKTKYNGAFITLANALNMDYLWIQVRVLGGAYGCSSVASPLGFVGFTSYRDPNIDRTIEIYNNATDFISNLNPNEEELFKFKIGAVASVIVVRHNSDKGSRAQLNYFNGLTYEASLKRYQEILSATLEDIHKAKDVYKEALYNSSVCVIGNEKAIDKAKLSFDKKRNLA